MNMGTAEVYADALRAIDESISEQSDRKVIEAIAQNLAASSGVMATGSFIDVALSLGNAKRGFLLWQVNKSLQHPILRSRIADLVANSTDIHFPGWETVSSDAAKAFERDGIAGISNLLKPGEAAEMMRYFEACENLARQESVLHHHIRDVARAPYAFRIATDERVLSIAHRFLGAPPTIVQMDAWWSLPKSDAPMGAQIFHRDRDDFRSCKLFVYLSDVSTDDGPHIFVRGSHRIDYVQKALSAAGIPLSQTGVLFSNHGRELHDTISTVFGSAVSEIVGPAGTAFLENTFGFHRGKVPTGRRRCLFQVLYASIPYPERLKRWAEAELTALPTDCADNARARHAVRFAVN